MSQEGFTVRERAPAIGYLGHVGFFRYLGLEFGKQPDEAPGSETYHPLTPISAYEIQQDSEDLDLSTAVDRRCAKVAAVVAPESETQQDLLRYCFREVIRNVFEHSHAESCLLLAQRYGQSEVEVAIIDGGRGIRVSLGERIDGLGAHDALHLAIQPGVSRFDLDNANNKNAGFGLYILSELGRRYGEFGLLSSYRYMRIASEVSFPRIASHRGTAVKLLLSDFDPEYFPNVLSTIVAAGEAASGRSGGTSGRIRLWL